MAQSHTNWRKAIPRSDRIQVCYHIFAKLRSYFPDIPEPALKQKTSRFESQAYISALSRQDYLDQVAEVLSKAESRKRRASPPQSSPTKRARSTPPPSPLKQPRSWRASVSRQDRVNACHYIVRNVDAMHPNLPHAAVIHMVSTFERQSFLKATSRREYIQRISKGLNKLRSHPALRGRAARHHVAHVTAQNRAPSCATNVSGASNMTSTSRTSSPQTVPPTLLDESEEEMDWRVGLTRRERLERCQRVLKELRSCYTDLEEEALKEKTRAFEEQAFERASNREEYDEAITAGLAMVRKQVGSNSEGASNKNERPDGKSGQGDEGRGPSPGEEVVGKRSWRKGLAREERVKNCQRMLIKLNVYYPGVDEQLMKEKVSVFECCAFACATGRDDYYAKIEEGLANVEEKMMGKMKGKEQVEGKRGTEVRNRGDTEDEEVVDESRVVEEEEEMEDRIDMAEEREEVGGEGEIGKGKGRDVGEEIEEMRREWEEEGERKEDRVSDEDFGEWLGCEDELILGDDMSWFKDDMTFPLDATV